jgi:hypothetical protein
MKIFFSFFVVAALPLFSAHASGDEILRIETVSYDSVEAIPGSDSPPASSLRMFEIYDVYEKSLSIEGKQIYGGFVDSVYLLSITDPGSNEGRRLVFGYVWEGEGKYMRNGYYLLPTGRKYAAEWNLSSKPDNSESVQVVQSRAGTGKGEMHLFARAGGVLDLMDSLVAETDEPSNLRIIGAELNLGLSLALSDFLGISGGLSTGRKFGEIELAVQFEYFLTFNFDPFSWRFYLGIGVGGSFVKDSIPMFISALGTRIEPRNTSVSLLDNSMLDLCFFAKGGDHIQVGLSIDAGYRFF